MGILAPIVLALFFSTSVASELYSIPFQTNSGDTTSLAAYKGQVVMVVNTASECGHTPQYANLEKLYEQYKSRGFVVLAFPSNDFGAQEPGSDAQIQQFCATNFGVTFPLMKKIPVLGEHKHPLYKHLVEQSEAQAEVEWNFTKFLIDRNGKVAARIHYRTLPDAPEVVAQIESLLEAKPSE